MANTNLAAAGAAKNDEFYTQYHDIEAAMTAYLAYDPDPGSKRYPGPWQPTIFETRSPRFRPARSRLQGKIFTLDRDANGDGRIDIDDL